MEPWQELQALSVRQHGLFTLQQALMAGLSAQTVQRHVHTRGLARLHRGVFAMPGSRDTPRRRAKAAELAIGSPVLITGWSAAYLWGLLPAAPSVVHVVLPTERKAPALRRVRPTRSSLLAPDDEEEVDGIGVTRIPLTLIMLARDAEHAFVRSLVIDARQRRLVDLPALRARTAALGRAPGTGTVRRVLDELDEERPDSVFEHRVRRRLRRDGFHPDPEPCAVVLRSGRTLHVDVPWRVHKVGLECDGQGSHMERSALDVDALRHNGLEDVEWRILRVTWTIYESHWAELTAQLRRLLRTDERRAG